MKTLKELIGETKCRKGASVAITKQGAFWLASPEIHIRSFGGDGVGNSATNRDNYLQLRHYRSGEAKAVVKYHGWHQNYGTSNNYQTVPILDCTTIEDVVAALKSVTNDDASAYVDWGYKNLAAALIAIGMTESLPAPDERCETRE